MYKLSFRAEGIQRLLHRPLSDRLQQPPAGKLVYAYITYTLLMMVYSANNIPYSALSGVITGDLGERTSLSSYRFVLAMTAAFIIQGAAMPMVEYFGKGNDAVGYQVTMGIFAVLLVGLPLTVLIWVGREARRRGRSSSCR